MTDMNDTTGTVRVRAVPVADGTRVLDPEEARRALMGAVSAIPADQLRNFRAGQITVVA